MKRSWTVLLLALLAVGLPAMVSAQGDQDVRSGPELSLLLWHPYPDSADPLGFPFDGRGQDGYYARYAHLDAERDGFDFPHMVMDGVRAVEGLPDNGRPYVSTSDAYRDAFEARRMQESPLTLEVSGTLDGEGADARVAVLPTTDLSSEDLGLWVALVEDHVQYTPPPEVSNGVSDHRFTVRAIQGPFDLDPAGPTQATVRFALPDDAVQEQIYITAWVQQGAGHGSRFDPHEVVQATTHRIADGGVTRQETKGVLMEVYSATWCDPCLFGDRVAEEMQAEYGVATVEVEPEGAGYWTPPARPWVVVLAAIAGAAAVAVPRLPGGRP